MSITKRKAKMPLKRSCSIGFVEIREFESGRVVIAGFGVNRGGLVLASTAGLDDLRAALKWIESAPAAEVQS